MMMMMMMSNELMMITKLGLSWKFTTRILKA